MDDTKLSEWIDRIITAVNSEYMEGVAVGSDEEWQNYNKALVRVVAHFVYRCRDSQPAAGGHDPMACMTSDFGGDVAELLDVLDDHIEIGW